MPLTLLDRLERRFGWLAVPHVTITLIVGQALLYFVGYMGANGILPNGASIDRVFLVPSLVMEGQVWRLATFVFQPPLMMPLFALFYFSLLYTFGTGLETQWGTFKYNLFLLIGYVANVAAAFIGWFVLQQQINPEGNEMLKLVAIPASNAYLYLSVFLAFARLYPDFTLNLFFVLPIRIKWLALLAWIGYAYVLLTGDWMARMMVLATILNYICFFGREHILEWKQGHRRRSFQSATKRAASPAKHTCAVCGLSSAESPRTLFRYCSKCSGQRCYCPDHIRDHEHVIDKEPVV